MRRALAGGLLAAATVLSGVAFSTAGGAVLAHHTTITCTDKESSTWTIENSEADKTMTFTSPQGPEGSISAGGSTTVVYQGSSLTIDGVWSNNVTNTSSGTGDCVPTPPQPPTVVRPAAPTAVPPTCYEPGSVVLPSEMVGYDWVIQEDGTYLAVPDPGFSFPEDAVTTFDPGDLSILDGEKCNDSTTSSTTSTTTSSTTTSSTTTTTVPPTPIPPGPGPTTTASTTTTIGAGIALPPTVPGQSVTTTASTPAPAPAPTPAPTTTAAVTGTLPTTGGSPWSTALVALIVIGLGFAAVRLSRRMA